MQMFWQFFAVFDILRMESSPELFIFDRYIEIHVWESTSLHDSSSLKEESESLVPWSSHHHQEGRQAGRQAGWQAGRQAGRQAGSRQQAAGRQAPRVKVMRAEETDWHNDGLDGSGMTGKRFFFINGSSVQVLYNAYLVCLWVCYIWQKW
jgi:hypothetical protein